MSSHLRGSATKDPLQNLAMSPGHGLSELLQVSGSSLEEHLMKRQTFSLGVQQFQRISRSEIAHESLQTLQMLGR